MNIRKIASINLVATVLLTTSLSAMEETEISLEQAFSYAKTLVGKLSIEQEEDVEEFNYANSLLDSIKRKLREKIQSKYSLDDDDDLDSVDSVNKDYLDKNEAQLIITQELKTNGFTETANIIHDTFFSSTSSKIQTPYDEQETLDATHTLKKNDLLSDDHGTQLEGHLYTVIAANFSPDGKYLATTSKKDVMKWNVEQKKAAIGIEIHNLSKIALSSNGKYLAIVANETLSAKIYNMEETKVVAFIPHASNDITAMAFSPNDTYFAIALKDNTVHIYYFNSSDEKPKTTLTTHNNTPIISLSLNENSIAIVFDNFIEVWNILEQRCLSTIITKTKSPIQSARISSAGSFISILYKDMVTELWDVKTASCKNININAAPGADTSKITSLDLSPDNTSIAVGFEDGTLKIYPNTYSKK